MAFKYKPAEQKLQFRLSKLAYEILSDDMFTFREKSMGPLLNRIFISFHAEAAASISIQAQKLRQELGGKELPEAEQLPEAAIDILCNKLSQKTKEATAAYPAEDFIRFYVQNDVLEYLTDESKLLDGYPCQEEAYYNNQISRYFRAIVEEYARKPYLKREQIYKKEVFRAIENVLKQPTKRYAIQLTMLNGKKHQVIPYKIETDPQGIYHYLVALPCRDPSQWMSYRISNIVSVDARKSESGFLSKKQTAEADAAIREHGVQFLSNDLVNVRVRLTEDGIKKYRSQLHLRPRVDHIENDSVYNFRCTEAQAEFYFFKYGADAEILEPASLAQKFKDMYQEAYKTYTRREPEKSTVLLSQKE